MGPLGGVAEYLAKARNRIVQAMIEIDKGVGGPNLRSQLLASDYFARVLQQSDQNLKGLFLQSDLRSVSAQFTCSQVQFEHTEPSRRITVNRNQRLTP